MPTPESTARGPCSATESQRSEKSHAAPPGEQKPPLASMRESPHAAAGQAQPEIKAFNHFQKALKSLWCTVFIALFCVFCEMREQPVRVTSDCATKNSNVTKGTEACCLHLQPERRGKKQRSQSRYLTMEECHEESRF